ncbi:hypothetical protein SAMD00019534_049060 [Acytostelium subglobosum LB1]|uniref:hypothetical protein n=1 Tax=Acytostelium subglobosum LB1 TaxID=1410327 RepID=UPI000644FA9A|nr:hypothetical protein SAMD00019534_049060 [Acytostelium subglobosum LB1]GAM21731.1 hypothetical protein SAMD00019534_049060 [Acytostelium subglobosum LB1]|eukprot:XP_012754831.1 hypothetical protein SAMD00019534_049060 [Acytostelium subglobosum LB1]
MNTWIDRSYVESEVYVKYQKEQDAINGIVEPTKEEGAAADDDDDDDDDEDENNDEVNNKNSTQTTTTTTTTTLKGSTITDINKKK